MATIALFHSVLGLRPGIADAARRLREQGHAVFPVDQYEGRVFDDYDEAGAFAGALGFPELMLRALMGVESLPDGFLCVGFSNGGGMAEHVAMHRSTAGVVMCSGALPLSMLGADAWPAGVPAQIHVAAEDPFRQPGWVETVAESVATASGQVELFEYPGAGHLFTDATLGKEYDQDATELLWGRVQAFCQRHG